jgi:hypothetical protein
VHFSTLAFVVIYSYIFRLASRLYLLVHGRPSLVLEVLEIFSIAFRASTDATVYLPKDALVQCKFETWTCPIPAGSLREAAPGAIPWQSWSGSAR